MLFIKLQIFLIRGAFRSKPKIYNDFFLRKHLTVFNRYPFPQKSFIIDVWQGSKYASVADIDYLQWSLLYLRNNASVVCLGGIISLNNTIVRNCFLLLIFCSILYYLTKYRFKGNQLLEAATGGVLYESCS